MGETVVSVYQKHLLKPGVVPTAMQRQTVFVLLGAIVLGAALLGAGVVIAGTAPTEAPSLTDPSDQNTDRTITVGATGKAEATPDKAIVRLSVEARSTDPAEARTQVAENVTEVRDALAAAGIDEESIRTEDFRISEDHRPRSRRDDKVERVFVARHRLSVEVSDIDRVGTVIDAAVDSGSAQIHDVRFTLSDETQDELRSAALEDAMDQARSQATTVAAAEGLTITGAQSMSTQDSHIPHRRVQLAAMEAGGDGGTDISSGPVAVTASVTVTYNATA